MYTKIKAKKDLYNNGKCFTKGRVYDLPIYVSIKTSAGLMELSVVNDQNEPHIIGSWWRNFTLVK